MGANVIDLTTVAAVNNLLAQAAGTDAALIQTEITNLSRYILNRTSRRNLSQILAFNETYSGTGADVQQLRNYPILAVQSLIVGTTQIPQSSGPNQPGWVIDQSGSQAALAIIGGGGAGNWSAAETPWRGGGWGNGNAPALGLPAYRFIEGRMNVQVQYQAGYALESYGEAQTVPATGPYTVAVAHAANFWLDQGVTLANGTVLQAVTGAPGPSQYTLPVYGVAPLGTYTFNAAQAGAAVNISYQYGGVPEDLNEAATKIVAVYYRRPKYLDQISQMQPGIGTTAYSRAEWPAECAGIIGIYKRRFLDN